MSREQQNYPLPQMFMVSGGGGQPHPAPYPNLVPCWSFPPAQERMRSRRTGSCMGASTSLVMTVLFLFLLVFAALGIGAYQIQKMQKEMEKLQTSEEKAEMQFSNPEMQTGLYEPLSGGKDKDDRAAAHVIGRIEKYAFNKTLRWEPHAGRAFTSGGVAYRVEDGSLQVDEAGLYHIYSRVELIFKNCWYTSSFTHSVFVRRAGYPSPLTLMKANPSGFCSKQGDHSFTSESYLGSALKLEKHDRVLVNVSHPAFLSHVHYANFFGLYKI